MPNFEQIPTGLESERKIVPTEAEIEAVRESGGEKAVEAFLTRMARADAAVKAKAAEQGGQGLTREAARREGHDQRMAA